uniref:Entry-fusion complex component n=1 Tax=Strongyloides venezuelensis TaxID=75913 RepID=A0A0K0EXJ4_STRVS
MTTLIIILTIWALLSTVLLILFILANFGVCTNEKYLKVFIPKMFKKYKTSNELNVIPSTCDNQSINSICYTLGKDIEFPKLSFEGYTKRHILSIEISSNSQEPSIIDPIEYYTLSRIDDSQFNNITQNDELKIFPIVDGKHKYVPCYVSNRRHRPISYCIGNEVNGDRTFSRNLNTSK